MPRRLAVAPVIATALASCSTPQARGADAVASYYAAKTAYIKTFQALQDSGKTYPRDESKALADLEARLHAIIEPMGIQGVWKPTFETVPVTGMMGGDELDGLTATVGKAQVIVSTPALARSWLAWHHAPFDDYQKALATEEWLTPTFTSDAAVFRFGDVASKAKLPSDVFLAQVITRAQDTGSPEPDQLIVGVDRGARFFLIAAPLEVQLPMPRTCGPSYADTFRVCYGTHLAELTGFPKIVAQVSALRAIIP